MTGQRRRLLAYLLVIAVGTGGFWRVETTVRQLEDTQDDICLSLDVLITLLGEESDADPARVQAFLDRFHDQLENC